MQSWFYKKKYLSGDPAQLMSRIFAGAGQRVGQRFIFDQNSNLIGFSTRTNILIFSSKVNPPHVRLPVVDENPGVK
jgi:hypothetical protein